MDKKIGKFKGIPTTESGMPVPIIAEYRLRKFTLNCRICEDWYCVTWHNGRQTAVTYYSKDKEAMNDFIREHLKEGYKRVR